MQALPRALRLAIPALTACILIVRTPAFSAGPSGSPADPTPRGFRAFLPKAGERADEPSAQLVQLLLDRQDKGDSDSYMVQALFRGKPAARRVRVRQDRIEIEFLDTGKPAMRLARIRGGAIEASSVEEFFYRLPAPPGKGSSGGGRTKRLVRLTLFMRAKPELRFRDTLDRTLIHFRLGKPAREK
jgi:hypothetical protein